jgi:hypothetical protein
MQFGSTQATAQCGGDTKNGSYIPSRRLWLLETNHASMSMMYEHINRPNPERQRHRRTG